MARRSQDFNIPEHGFSLTLIFRFKEIIEIIILIKDELFLFIKAHKIEKLKVVKNSTEVSATFVRNQ